MKGKKCFGLLLVLSIIFGLSLNVSQDVNAYTYQDVSWKGCTSGILRWNNGGYVSIPSLNNSCNTSVSGITNTSGVNYLSINFSGSIAGGSLATVYIRIRAPIDGEYPQIGWGAKSGAYTVVDTTFGEYGLTAVTLYFDQTISGSIDLTPTGLGNFPSIDLKISPIYLVYLQAEPTRQQITDITAILNTLNSNIDLIPGKIESVITILNSLASDSDRTADAVEEQNQKDEQDRNNMESQQSDSESGAEDSQADAEATGTTLLGAFTGFVGALTSATPSNCNIDMDLGNLDLGVVNLCQLSLPQPFPTIASIMLILFCVPLSIATATKLINLFRSFQ